MVGDPLVTTQGAHRLTVEEVYHQYWGKVGGVGRLRRTFSLREDAILSKLLWIQQGSERSRRDVVEMLKRDEELDLAILRERAAALGLHDLLAELEQDMREARDQGLQPHHT